MFIKDTLSTLLPTSLADDDYAYYSTLLRSLETRTDLTPLVVEESGVKQTILALGNRRDTIGRPMAEEPFDLQARFTALHIHWFDQEKRFPERWDAAYDTTPIPPILQARGLVDDGTAEKVLSGDVPGTEGVKLELTPEQEKASDKAWWYYSTNRKHKISYFKGHPPTPLGAAPRAALNQPFKIHNIWDNLMSSGKGDNVEWKPIYGSLRNEFVPTGWRDPDNEDGVVNGMTMAEFDEWWAEQEVENAKRDEREAKIKAWQDEVRLIRQAEENAKWEKLRKEREEAQKAEL
jgi:hypothetical protein